MSEVQTESTTEPEIRDEEGRTPAAWTCISIMLVAFCVSTLGLSIYNWPMFWVGVGIFVIGAIVGKVMAAMGYGQHQRPKN